MKPIEFKEQNYTFEPPKGLKSKCLDLPCYLDENSKQVISCWKITFRERIALIFGGDLWMGVSSSPPPPMWLDTKKPFREPWSFKIPFKHLPIFRSIKNLFAPKCGSCIHHSGGSTCSKLGGHILAQSTICGHYKKPKKRKRK